MFANVQIYDRHFPEPIMRTNGFTNVTKQFIWIYATLSFGFQLQCMNCFCFVHKLCPWGIPIKKNPFTWGLGNPQVIQCYPIIQSMCLDKLHQGELLHRNGNGEVLHLAESKSRRRHQTSHQCVDWWTPAAKLGTWHHWQLR